MTWLRSGVVRSTQLNLQDKYGSSGPTQWVRDSAQRRVRASQAVKVLSQVLPEDVPGPSRTQAGSFLPADERESSGHALP